MKKKLALLLVFMLIISAFPLRVFAATVRVAPATVTLVYPDGEQITVDTRNIEGNNSMMLREAIYLFGGGVAAYPRGGTGAYKVTSVGESVTFTKNIIDRAQSMNVRYDVTPLYDEFGNRLDLGIYSTIYFVEESRNYIPLRGAEAITNVYSIGDFEQNGNNTVIYLDYKNPPIDHNPPQVVATPRPTQRPTVTIPTVNLIINEAEQTYYVEGYSPSINHYDRDNGGDRIYRLTFDTPVDLTISGGKYDVFYVERNNGDAREGSDRDFGKYRWLRGEIKIESPDREAPQGTPRPTATPRPARSIDVEDLDFTLDDEKRNEIWFEVDYGNADPGDEIYVGRRFEGEDVVRVEILDGRQTKNFYPNRDGKIIFTVPKNNGGEFMLITENNDRDDDRDDDHDDDDKNDSKQPDGTTHISRLELDERSGGNYIFKLKNGDGEKVWIPNVYDGRKLISVDCYDDHLENRGKGLTVEISGQNDDGFSYISVWFE